VAERGVVRGGRAWGLVMRRRECCRVTDRWINIGGGGGALNLGFQRGGGDDQSDLEGAQGNVCGG
jgi:hypothetical protein